VYYLFYAIAIFEDCNISLPAAAVAAVQRYFTANPAAVVDMKQASRQSTGYAELAGISCYRLLKAIAAAAAKEQWFMKRFT